MPVPVSYPGVYIEEVPSGVRTITGVATSITAFVGRAMRGPIDDPITVFSWGDFERIYGGLAIDYPMSYAVRDFFLNGGTEAVIARLYLLANPADPNRGHATKTHGVLNLRAASPGTWGNSLALEINYSGIDASEIGVPARKSLYDRYDLDPDGPDDLFNLLIRDDSTGLTEQFANVTFRNVARNVGRVLEQESTLVKLNGAPPAPETSRPSTISFDASQAKFSGGADSEGGDSLYTDTDLHSQDNKSGLYLLEKVDLFNLLCIPPDSRNGNVPPAFWVAAMGYCVDRRAMLIVDSNQGWGSPSVTISSTIGAGWLSDLGLTGTAARNAAIFYPRVKQADPLREGQVDDFVPCGIIAGVMARTDARRGVWKAPAGVDDGVLNGTQGLQLTLTNRQNGALNPLGINCLRSFPVVGRVVWGARTLRGADQLADEYKYLPIRRTALFIEETLYRGLQWVVFEPNDEPLWAQIRLNAGAFMHTLFRQGAFQGTTPRDAYFVKCDKETTTQYHIDLGIVNIVVGFAPLKPAEFVIIKLQQIAGQLEV